MAGTAKAASNMEIMNSMRAYMSTSYQDRIPLATQENIAGLYETILTYDGIRNDFVSSLVNMIALQRIETLYFRNPLVDLKSAPMRYGETEQEIYVDMVKAREFDPYAGADKLFAYYDSEVMAAYHKINHEAQYPITVTFDNLREAFLSEYGIRDMINAKTESLVTSEQWDEYKCMMSLIDSAYASGQIFPVTIADPTNQATMEQTVIAVRTYAQKIRFPNRAFNIAGADSAANVNAVYCFLTPEMDAQLDVNVLAYAFNMDKADINLRKIVIDEFRNPAVKMVIFDQRWFKVRDQYKIMTSNNGNGAALTWNYFYTVAEMFSYSPFFPIIAFTTDKFDVTAVTVTAVTDAVAGNVIPITALASTSTSGSTAQQYLSYTVSGQTSTKTSFIPGTNQLMIGRDEKAYRLTVTATSRYAGYFGTDVSGTATVTIPANKPAGNA